MVLFAGTFLDYLIPGSYPFYLICLLILILSLIILRTHIYHHFEKVMAILVLILGISLLVFMSQYPITLIETVSGIIPSVPVDSEKEILAIIGAVGSGLMLMLYSVWLEKKIRVRNNAPETKEEDKFQIGNKKKYYEYLHSVRLDILIGFILVAVITIGFMAIGQIGRVLSFIPHGTEISIDMMMTMVLKLYHSLPFGNLIFFILITVVFFGATVIGLDARASAITKLIKEMRKNAGHPVKNSSLIYNLCLLCFSLIVALVILYNQPLSIMLYISLICAIFFGIFGFILLYLNTKLPEYAQGSRLWILFIGIGSVLSIYFALVLEGSILGMGMQLAQKLIFIIVGLYLFCRSRMFTRLTNGIGTLADKFWLIAILATISVLGTVWGIQYFAPTGELLYVINFRDFGAIIGGIIGGPVIGGIVGLIGGLFRLSSGDVSAIPCCIATIAAGIIAGYLIRYRKGKLTYLWAAIIGIVVESFHMFFIYPTYMMLTHKMTALATLDVIRNIVLPMMVVIIIGLIFFTQFSANVPCFKTAMLPFSFKRVKDDWKELVSTTTKRKEKDT